MDISEIIKLHRNYFETQIKEFVNGSKEYRISTGKYIFPCNKYYNKHTNKVNTTNTLYSIYLIDVINNDEEEITYIKENKSIKFQNIITVFDDNELIRYWRSYRRLLEISELKEYTKLPCLHFKRSDYKEMMTKMVATIRNFFHEMSKAQMELSSKFDLTKFDPINTGNNNKENLIFYLDPKHHDN